MNVLNYNFCHLEAPKLKIFICKHCLKFEMSFLINIEMFLLLRTVQLVTKLKTKKDLQR